MTDVRSRFPGLSDGWVRFDGPAGTLPVDTCVDAIADYMRSPAVANLGGEFAASKASDAVVDGARAAIARLVNAEADEVVIGPSTTNLTFNFTRALAQHWKPGDRIVCTQLDHDSNISPWLLAASDAGATVELLELPSGGHGLNGCKGPLWEQWKTAALRWSAQQGIIPPAKPE